MDYFNLSAAYAATHEKTRQQTRIQTLSAAYAAAHSYYITVSVFEEAIADLQDFRRSPGH